MLSRVHPGLLGCSPGRGVDGRALVLWALQRLPVHKERNGILGLGHAVVGLAGGNTGGRARNNTSGHGLTLHDPAVDIDVMRVQVVAAWSSPLVSDTSV